MGYHSLVILVFGVTGALLFCTTAESLLIRHTLPAHRLTLLMQELWLCWWISYNQDEQPTILEPVRRVQSLNPLTKINLNTS